MLKDLHTPKAIVRLRLDGFEAGKTAQALSDGGHVNETIGWVAFSV